MHKNIKLHVPSDKDEIQLKTSDQEDLLNLRQWKNSQCEYFFYQDVISLKQQQNWFYSYLNRADDFMFIVMVGQVPIGCMGIRYIDSEWDIYNVILGIDDFGKKGIMSKAFQSLLDFANATKQSPLTLKVLKHNPAVAWYQKNGFEIESDMSSYYRMIYRSKNTTQDYLS